MKDKIAIDLGFSAAKFKIGNKTGMIPSSIKKARGIEKSDAYNFKGQFFFVGEEANLRTGSENLKTIEDLIEYYPLFASYIADTNNIQKDQIAVGLPLDDWKKEYIKKQKKEPNKIEKIEKVLKTRKNKIFEDTGSARIEEIIFIGGGANLMKNVLKKSPIPTVISDNPEYSNVEAFYSKMQKQNKEET